MNNEIAIAVLTPSTGICRIEYSQALSRLIGYFAQTPIEENKSQTITTDAILGSGIAENYQRMVIKYLNDKEHYWTHFLSIEDDMSFPPDALHKLARHKKAIVGANYSVNKGKPLRFTAANTDRTVLTKEDSEGLEEVSLLPQGFTLVAREVYESIPKPWFLMGYSPVSGNYVYQDYYFSEKARQAGYKLYVDHDLSKQIIHIGTRYYTWRDALEDELQNQESEDK